MFNAPIPGQSLTGEPKKYPWERPPELVKAEDVANHYLDKLTEEETMRSILDTLSFGDVTLKQLVEGITRIGVSEGLHTIDAGLLVSPLIHKTIKVVADGVGLEYDEGLVDTKAKEESAKNRKRLQIKKALSKVDMNTPEDVAEQPKLELETTVEDKPQGFMARRK